MNNISRRLGVLASQLLGRTDSPSAPPQISQASVASEDSSDASSDEPAAPAPLLVISQDVQSALAAGKPVVALESTIITHGMPYPQNLETAREVERIVRSNGATPATVAVIRGVPHVGLTDSQLEYLAKAGHKAVKCSRRDLARCVALGLDGATTVSGTMVLADLAGVRVFVTGGIGGVHRGGETSMDVSADLTELGRTPVLVVCAGVKSILDIPRTLEYLETQGVAVAALGTSEFPAFFSRRSGCEAPSRVESEEEAAGAFAASLGLGLESGMVLAVPVPREHEAEGAAVQEAIDRALAEVDEKGIRGRDVTPFLLSRVNELSGGVSLKANIALVKNNAAVGARVAAALVES